MWVKTAGIFGGRVGVDILRISHSFQPIVWLHLRRFSCSFYLSLVMELGHFCQRMLIWCDFGLLFLQAER